MATGDTIPSVGEISPAPQKTMPIKRPPATLAARPSEVTPPLVPLRTGRREVMRRGSASLSCPSSLAQVSPQQLAKYPGKMSMLPQRVRVNSSVHAVRFRTEF